MNNLTQYLKWAFIFPILCLMGLTGYKAYIFYSGTEYTLKIEGYDPRDLLSGNYLIYRIQYGVVDQCAKSRSINRKAYICLDPKRFSYTRSSSCKALISGKCEGGRFTAGIERFFIPESHAKALEKAVIEKRGKIILSVTPSGKTQIKDLLIDDKPWKEIVE